MALDYTYCGDAGYPRPHMSSLANFKQDDGFGNLIETWPLDSREQGTWPLDSREQGTRFFTEGTVLGYIDLFSGY